MSTPEDDKIVLTPDLRPLITRDAKNIRFTAVLFVAALLAGVVGVGVAIQAIWSIPGMIGVVLLAVAGGAGIGAALMLAPLLVTGVGHVKRAKAMQEELDKDEISAVSLENWRTSETYAGIDREDPDRIRKAFQAEGAALREKSENARRKARQESQEREKKDAEASYHQTVSDNERRTTQLDPAPSTLGSGYNTTSGITPLGENGNPVQSDWFDADPKSTAPDITPAEVREDTKTVTWEHPAPSDSSSTDSTSSTGDTSPSGGW